MHADLFPYQREGAAFLAARQAAMLADDMGVGKTPQAVAACDVAGVQTAVVVCPGIARANWQREFVRWQTTPRTVEVVMSPKDLLTWRVMCADVLVISYNLLQSDAARKQLNRNQYDALICDEAHLLKEPKSIRARAIYGSKFDRSAGLSKRCARTWLLTGTPILNHPGELWTHIRALWPEDLEKVCGTRRTSFLEHFVAFDDSGKARGARRPEALLRLLKPHTLRRLQSEVQAGLPALVWDHIAVSPDTLPPMPPELAEAATVAAAALAKAAGNDQALEALQAESMHLATLRRWTGVAKAEVAAELIRSYIAEGLGPVVVFALHTAVIDTLHKALPGSRVLSGATKMADRQASIDAFQAGELPAIVCQITVASTALTLTRGSLVVFVESSWVPADMMQSAKRCHRIGQKQTVFAKVISLAGSIDETVAEVITRKAAIISKLELAN